MSPNKPLFRMRGVMLDLGRITERRAYYEALLPWLAEWGYNLIHLHLLDDQRCGLRFPRRPELATTGAFTADEMRAFVARAGQCGLTVLPEIETLGHAARITSHPKYRHLKEALDPATGFNAICPGHPDTRRLIADLLADVADIFPHNVIHVGLDEVQLGECPRCRRRFGTNAEAWQRFAAHAAWVQEETRRLGRRPAMWADHVVSEPRILKSFQRDVLLFHWHYLAEYNSVQAAHLLDEGFEVVACPALVCSLTRVAPNKDNLANLRNATARSRLQQVRGKGVTGMVSTVWCPWRYLPGAIDYGLALAAHLIAAGREQPDFAATFAKHFYGLPDGRRVGAALDALYEASPDCRLYDRIVRGARLEETFNREDLRQSRLLVTRISGVLAALRAERKQIRRNRARYDDLIVSAQTILAVARYGAANRRKSGVADVRVLSRCAAKQWARDRWPNDAMRMGDPSVATAESLLDTLRRIG